MLKRILLLSILPALLISCADSKKEKEDDNQTPLKVEKFLEKQAEMVEKKVTLEGTVTHVCAHGGKKLFIMGSDPEKTVKITTGEGITKFDKELEGSDVLVSGVVKELKIDEAYLAEWEKELGIPDSTQIDTAQAEEHEAEHKGGGQGDDFHHGDGMAQINAMRKKLEKSEKGHLSFYSVECNKIEEKKNKE